VALAGGARGVHFRHAGRSILAAWTSGAALDWKSDRPLVRVVGRDGAERAPAETIRLDGGVRYLTFTGGADS
jgi:hypothetical protein